MGEPKRNANRMSDAPEIFSGGCLKKAGGSFLTGEPDLEYRFFILRAGVLSWYRSRSALSCLGSVELRHATRCCKLDRGTAGIDLKVDMHHGSMLMRGKREEIDAWAEVISRHSLWSHHSDLHEGHHQLQLKLSSHAQVLRRLQAGLLVRCIQNWIHNTSGQELSLLSPKRPKRIPVLSEQDVEMAAMPSMPLSPRSPNGMLPWSPDQFHSPQLSPSQGQLASPSQGHLASPSVRYNSICEELTQLQHQLDKSDKMVNFLKKQLVSANRKLKTDSEDSNHLAIGYNPDQVQARPKSAEQLQQSLNLVQEQLRQATAQISKHIQNELSTERLGEATSYIEALQDEICALEARAIRGEQDACNAKTKMAMQRKNHIELVLDQGSSHAIELPRDAAERSIMMSRLRTTIKHEHHAALLQAFERVRGTSPFTGYNGIRFSEGVSGALKTLARTLGVQQVPKLDDLECGFERLLGDASDGGFSLMNSADEFSELLSGMLLAMEACPGLCRPTNESPIAVKPKAKTSCKGCKWGCSMCRPSTQSAPAGQTDDQNRNDHASDLGGAQVVPLLTLPKRDD